MEGNKKAKKYRKRAEAGEVNALEQYLKCLEYRIQEIRDLLRAIFDERFQIPKFFEVRNRAWIRDVVILHFVKSPPRVSDASPEPPQAMREWVALKVRVTKQHQPHLIPSFPLKLLTLPKDEEPPCQRVTQTISKDVSIFSQYILSQTSLATWGYPLPISSRPADPDSQPIDSDSIQQIKRRRTEEETPLSEPSSFATSPTVSLLSSVSPTNTPHSFVGLRSGTLVTREESQRRLATGNRILVTDSKDYSLWKNKKRDFPIASLLPLQSHAEKDDEDPEHLLPSYFQTIHHPSTVFGAYCSTPDCRCSFCSSNRELLALDCEMCDTEAGLELTRISIVDFNGVVLLDALVKPLTPILNYRQEFSGISAELLDPVTISLEQIQLACLQIISADTILVGHSLENDLRALRLCHLRCIDTSVIYPHPKGYPLRNKLKYLAKEYLGKNIQAKNHSAHDQLSPTVCDWNGGHSSVEDACTALELVKLKAIHGPKFGIKGKNSFENREPLLSFLPLHVTSCFHWTDSDTMHSMRSCVSPRSDGTLCCRNTETMHKAMKRFQSFQKTCTANAHSLHFISLNLEGLPLQESVKFEKEVVMLIEDHLQEQRDVMLMVCHEKSQQKLLELQRRKTACMKASSVSVWNKELEEELQKEVSEMNIVEMRMGIIHKGLPRQSSPSPQQSGGQEEEKSVSLSVSQTSLLPTPPDFGN